MADGTQLLIPEGLVRWRVRFTREYIIDNYISKVGTIKKKDETLTERAQLAEGRKAGFNTEDTEGGGTEDTEKIEARG